MYKLLSVCFLAFAIAKWNQNVQATGEIGDEEKRLLQVLEKEFEQEKRESVLCDTEACDEDCQLICCLGECDDMDCLADCYSLQEKRTAASRHVLGRDNDGSKKKRLWRRMR